MLRLPRTRQERRRRGRREGKPDEAAEKCVSCGGRKAPRVRGRSEGVGIMKAYESPNAELISFPDEKIMTLTASGCDCQWSGYDQIVDVNNPNYNEECGAVSGGAEENPYGIAAPNWGVMG